MKGFSIWLALLVGCLRIGYSQDREAIHPTGSFYALIIGESEYNNPKLSLDRPAKDAARFREVLIKYYTFEEKNVKLLTSATRKEIIAELYNLRKTITPNDNLVIFYAGHGYWDDQSQQGYWWPRDAAIEEPSEWLSNSDLKEQIRGIKTAHTLLISDACFSGGIFKTRGAAELVRNASLNIQMQYKMPSRRAMTSGTMTTVPDESVFFTYLVKRLVENKEKFLPSQDLFASLKQAVINNSMVVPQDGVISDAGDEGGDFIFILRDGSSAGGTSAAKSTSSVTRGSANSAPSASDLLEEGKNLYGNKKYAEAAERFTRVLALDSQNYEARICRGRSLNSQHKFEEAAKDFTKAIRLKPDMAWGYCLRGIVSNETRHYKRALIDLSKAIEINPRYTNAYNFRGFANMELRKYEDALNDFNETIKLDAKHFFAFANRGLLKVKMGKYEEAITDLTKVVDMNPAFAVAYSDRGLARLMLGNNEDAFADISKAIELDQHIPRAYNNRGLYYLKLNQTDKALQDFAKAMELGPFYMDPRMHRAEIYFSQHDKAKALAELNQLLQIIPAYPDALELKSKIQQEK